MTSATTAQNKTRTLTARRVALLATVAAIGGAVLFTSPGFSPKASFGALNSVAYAQSVAQRPVGFADIVEKVKPAVISVRVKMNATPRMMGLEGNSPFRQGSPMDRFFRQFAQPDGGGNNSDNPRSCRVPAIS